MQPCRAQLTITERQLGAERKWLINRLKHYLVRANGLIHGPTAWRARRADGTIVARKSKIAAVSAGLIPSGSNHP